METHRYVRKKLTQGTVDAYDSLSSKHSPSNFTRIEYWTNGFTTHLMSTPDANVVTPPPISASSFQTTTTSFRPSTPVSQKAQENVVRNSILAGSLAGIASTLACHPFDVLRTKMQAATMDFSSSAVSSNSSASISTINRAASLAARGVTASTTTTALAGPLQVLAHTVHHGGIAALYTGLAMPVAAQALYKSTLFTVNNVTQRFLVDWNTQERLKTGNLEPYRISLSDRFWCGFVGGAINAICFVTPVEFVRNQLIAQHTRLAAQPQQASPLGLSQPRAMGSIDVIRHTIAQQGIAGMWRGVGMTIARDSLGCGCFFWAMAWTQRYCKSHHYGMSELNVNLLSGAMAGLGFWAVALPLDTVKTWIQTGATSSAVDAVRQSYQQRGLVGTAKQLTRGWQVAFGRGAPSAAITVVTYEYCYKYLQN